MTQRLNIALIAAVTAVMLVSLCGPAHSESYDFLSQWGDNRPALSTQLHKPRGVAVDSLGSVYVSDVGDGKIVKHDPNGNILNIWNTCGGTALGYPMEMTVGPDNLLYVADMGNNRVCVFDLQGNYVRTITAEFDGPLGVAVDDALNLYVTQRRSQVVKKLDSSGNLLATWTGFSSPWGIMFYNGYVYVTNSRHTNINMVKKLTPGGTVVKEWGPHGIGNGQFRLAEGIVAHNNLLYVSDGEYGRIHVFDLEGNFIKMIGERGTGNGQLQFSTALAIDPARNRLYASDDDNDRLMIFDLDGNYVDQWGCDSSGTTGLRYPTKIAVDNNNGVMYVVDSGSHRIIKMTTQSMTFLKTWGSYGSGNGRFRFPFAAAVDSSGNVYVLDSTARNIQKFDPEGIFLGRFDFNSAPLLTDPLIYKYGMQGIAFDSADNMYVVDVDTQKLYKIAPAGNKLAGWNIPYYSTGVAVDETNGFIYVSGFGVGSSEADAVKQYTMNGVPTGKLIGKGYLLHPYDVALDPNGNLFITSTFGSVAAKYDPIGNLLESLGTQNVPGIGPGVFAYPYGVAVDGKGYLFVADTNNHRIQKFARVVFNDTPGAYWALPFINTLYDAGITSGCGGGNYCPENSVTRAQMAVFVLTALGEQPAASCTGTFADVNVATVGGTFCRYIEKFATLGITGGCGGGNYCPNDPVTRAQMAVFLTVALGQSPSSCTGSVFSDVNSSMGGFCGFIEKFSTLGITAGCGGGKYCPNDPVTRAQMAVFLSTGFLN